MSYLDDDTRNHIRLAKVGLAATFRSLDTRPGIPSPAFKARLIMCGRLLQLAENIADYRSSVPNMLVEMAQISAKIGELIDLTPKSEA